jgi:hypothetical protein
MSEPDYTYEFSDIGERQSYVKVTIHRTGEERTFTICVDDEDLARCRRRDVSQKLADLMDIAVAVYAADRTSKREPDIQCNIKINLPVRHPEVFNNPDILKRLEDILYWYTEDNWSFQFHRRQSCGRFAEWQSNFSTDAGEAVEASEVALWSGGLDSLTGLYNRLSERSSSRFTLFGTGGNNIVHQLQKEIALGAANILSASIELVRVPIHLIHKTYKLRQLNRISRSRGFVFLLTGAVCALLEGSNELFIYENGIGAINLNFGAPEVGLDHSRSVHPNSLIMMSDFVSAVIGVPFAFRNPFVFSTKAQMCRIFAPLPKSQHNSVLKLIANTVSCDRCRRKPKQRIQCGVCSSCLLRRQALLAAGLEDRTDYLYASTTSDESHLPHMLFQIEKLAACVNSKEAWRDLSIAFPETLPDAARQMARFQEVSRDYIQDSLINLYKQYIREWDRVGPMLLPNLALSKDLQAIHATHTSGQKVH